MERIKNMANWNAAKVVELIGIDIKLKWSFQTSSPLPKISRSIIQRRIIRRRPLSKKMEPQHTLIQLSKGFTICTTSAGFFGQETAQI